MSICKNTTFVGLDAHARTINVAVILPGSAEVDEQWQINHDARSLRRLAKKLLTMAPEDVYAVYEAGPCGFALKRTLDKLGVRCEVVAPSLIPVKPGDRVKTDPRDARKLATLLRGAQLTTVHPPNETQEALRDLMRAREDAKKDLMSARHRLTSMLLRRGLRFDQTKNWSKRHRTWLYSLRFAEPYAQEVFDNYLLAIEQIEERLKNLDALVEKAATAPEYVKPVQWLCCLRGVDTVAAMTILAELHDFQRFVHPRDLMGYLGLAVSEYTTSNNVRRGGITKTGNSHVRRILVEAAWNYRHRPAVKGKLKKRREGQPPAVLAIADKAQQRLYKRFHHLKEGYRKHANIVAVAVARELAGFVWAVLHHDPAWQPQ